MTGPLTVERVRETVRLIKQIDDGGITDGLAYDLKEAVLLAVADGHPQSAEIARLVKDL